MFVREAPGQYDHQYMRSDRYLRFQNSTDVTNLITITNTIISIFVSENPDHQQQQYGESGRHSQFQNSTLPIMVCVLVLI